MPLINSKIKLILTWSPGCVITNSLGTGAFAIPGTNSMFLR